MSQPNASSSAAYTERLLSADARRVFEAIENPDQCSRWWGPAGFTNTFKMCEFRNGGRWSFVMHGPDGQDYPNRARFEVLEADPRRIERVRIHPRPSEAKAAEAAEPAA